MSEFECRNGHLMLPSLGTRCHICGAPVAYMDGKNSKQLEYEDEMYEARIIDERYNLERDFEWEGEEVTEDEGDTE